MIAKLPYRSVWDVTPCTIRLNAGGYTEDGEPMEAHSWTGKVNFSERAGRIQDKDGVWVKLSGVIHVKGDILPGVVFTEGTALVDGYGREMKIVSYSRPRNPDGSVNHTRLELI
ncbi:MAG: hypothetical protein MSC43_02385 [Clostridiales bacterium]|nr:hypothetical protein [Clostridiales bacterium]